MRDLPRCMALSSGSNIGRGCPPKEGKRVCFLTCDWMDSQVSISVRSPRPQQVTAGARANGVKEVRRVCDECECERTPATERRAWRERSGPGPFSRNQTRRRFSTCACVCDHTTAVSKCAAPWHDTGNNETRTRKEGREGARRAYRPFSRDSRNREPPMGSEVSFGTAC